MATLKPPPLATRLLKQLVPAQDHEALLGDLSEEFQRRRSVTWYCLQILASIIVRSWKDIRTHKLLALRATVVGVALELLAAGTMVRLFDVLTGGGVMLGGTWIGLPWYWHSPYLSWSFWPTLRVLSIAAGVAQGWILVRLHRQHGITMLLAFRGVEASIAAGLFLSFAIVAGLRGDVVAPLFLTFRSSVYNLVINSSSMLAGGYLATRRAEAHETS